VLRNATRVTAASAALVLLFSWSPTSADPAGAALTQARKDIAYVPGAGIDQMLDLYLPRGSGAGPHPLVIFIHGGRWAGGDKSVLPERGDMKLDEYQKLLLTNGYAIATLNYRLSGDATYPAQVHDVKAATRYLRANATDLGLDPDRFAAVGESAGGHLAMMLGTTGDDPSLEGDLGTTGVSSTVQAVVSYYGVSDLPNRAGQRDPSCEPITGRSPSSSENAFLGADLGTLTGDGLAVRASPITYVDKADPATLLFHGRKDCNVSYLQSETMHDALVSAGVASELTLIEAAHAEAAFFGTPALQQQLLTFLKTYLTAR
jgi:acetyl esterase/lipase